MVFYKIFLLEGVLYDFDLIWIEFHMLFKAGWAVVQYSTARWLCCLYKQNVGNFQELFVRADVFRDKLDLFLHIIYKRKRYLNSWNNQNHLQITFEIHQSQKKSCVYWVVWVEFYKKKKKKILADMRIYLSFFENRGFGLSEEYTECQQLIMEVRV